LPPTVFEESPRPADNAIAGVPARACRHELPRLRSVDRVRS
jgi:hypothetical protein